MAPHRTYLELDEFQAKGVCGLEHLRDADSCVSAASILWQRVDAIDLPDVAVWDPRGGHLVHQAQQAHGDQLAVLLDVSGPGPSLIKSSQGELLEELEVCVCRIDLAEVGHAQIRQLLVHLSSRGGVSDSSSILPDSTSP